MCTMPLCACVIHMPAVLAGARRGALGPPGSPGVTGGCETSYILCKSIEPSLQPPKCETVARAFQNIKRELVLQSILL